MKWAPRERAGGDGEEGALVYGRTALGGFCTRVDADGDLWHIEEAVALVDWNGSMGYCQWLAKRTGKEWRLPQELEWEKAARGVDGRYFPWGDNLDPSWCCMRESHAERALPSEVDTYPIDESPYGVRGLGGNVMDWCVDEYRREGPEVENSKVPQWNPERAVNTGSSRVIRGGGWYRAARHVRSALRDYDHPAGRYSGLGFRPARTVP